MGEEETRSLGLTTRPLRMLLIMSATLITASAVAVSGVIGWGGLVIPLVIQRLQEPIRVQNTYALRVLESAGPAARRFVDLLLSEPVKTTLVGYGFMTINGLSA